MDVYTHDSYTLVRATAMMREAVAHLLTHEIPEDLARELQSWRRPGQGKGEGRVQEVEGEPIPFQLVKRIHEQLQKMPMGGSLCGHLVQQTPNYGWVGVFAAVYAKLSSCLGANEWVCVCYRNTTLQVLAFALSPVLIGDQKTGDREGLGMRLTTFSSNLCVTSWHLLK